MIAHPEAKRAAEFRWSGPLSCWQACEKKQHIRWDLRDGMDSEVKPSLPGQDCTLWIKAVKAF